MKKPCVCEICTCGRHRCPHHPTNHLGRGEGPCKVTEYTQVYKPHPLGPRETFKPDARPMQGGEFSDQTTQRVDYHPHPLERPFQHQHEQYVKPQGEFADRTSYNTEFVEKRGVPAKAIRNDGQRLVPGRFEGEPTYKSDYRKWDAAGRQQPYGMTAAWEPPKDRFQGSTTFQDDFRRKEIGPRVSFKPDNGPHMSDAPFDDNTIHRANYKQHAIPPRYVKEREQYKPPGVQFDGSTTFKADYRGQPGEPTHSFKPAGQAFQSNSPLDDHTTQRDSYKKWPMERPYVHAQEQYVKPEGEFAGKTTHNATYVPMPLSKVAAMRPVESQKASAPFDGSTMYKTDYAKKIGERAQPLKQPEYVQNNARFEGASTYGSHYHSHPVQATKSFRPEYQAVQGGHFEDRTMYRQDYVPKEIQPCPAAIIDQPASTYRFAGLDSRGHKTYEPVHTSIQRLQAPSPMQSQQRLGMSVA